MERDGVFHFILFYILIIAYLMLFLNLNNIENYEKKLITKFRNFTIFKIMIYIIESKIIFYILCFGIFLYSLFEIMHQPNFVNEWSAHLHHIEELYQTWNYKDLMHYNGM